MYSLCSCYTAFSHVCICYFYYVLQIKQETDEFVHEREQRTQDMELQQRHELEQFDLHSLTLGLGAVTDGDADSPAVSVRDSSLSLLPTPSPGTASPGALRWCIVFLPCLRLVMVMSSVLDFRCAGELCDNGVDRLFSYSCIGPYPAISVFHWTLSDLLFVIMQRVVFE